MSGRDALGRIRTESVMSHPVEIERLQDLIPVEVSAEAFMEVDGELTVYEEATVLSIVEDIKQDRKDDEGEVEEVDDEEKRKKTVTLKEATAALEILKDFMKQQGVEDMIDPVCLRGAVIAKSNAQQENKTTIQDFFKK